MSEVEILREELRLVNKAASEARTRKEEAEHRAIYLDEHYGGLQRDKDLLVAERNEWAELAKKAWEERDRALHELARARAELSSHHVPETWGDSPDYVPDVPARIARMAMQRDTQALQYIAAALDYVTVDAMFEDFVKDGAAARDKAFGKNR